MAYGGVVADGRARDELTPSVRALADRAFSRAAGAPLVAGNAVRLLRDGRENYPAWIDAIGRARHHVHFESYFLRDDSAGRMVADALSAAARRGVSVRLIYDWLGALGRASRGFWNRLRADGIEVRCYNPPRLEAPLAWISRDHRKMLAVDGEVGFITGLCVGQMWLGDPANGIEPWRDTGIEVRGPAVADIERAFARIWGLLGSAFDEDECLSDAPRQAGSVSLRVVASEPATAGMLRVDQLITALARERVWLTDAYYAGTTLYVQALRAAAEHGVDVRLLVPGSTDIPLLRPLTRSGYRPLLESGVRVFEWNGTMLHAKTAVADGHWARVGSTNLNVASWLGNCELDAIIEDERFAREIEEMYLEDLGNATEIVLAAGRHVRPSRPADLSVAPASARDAQPGTRSGRGRHARVGPQPRGSAGRAAAGAVRIGNALGAAFTNRRTLGPVEARLAATAGVVLLALAALFAIFPRVLAYPIVVILAWVAVSLLYRGYKLHRERTPEGPPPPRA
jgi:cardiolipin synthase A/B